MACIQSVVNKRELELELSAVFQFWPCFNSSNKWTDKAVAPSNWRLKRRDRDARMLSCLIYFFVPFSKY